MWDKTLQYLKKIGGVILIGVIIIWALGYFPRTSEETMAIDKQIENIQVDETDLAQQSKIADLHAEQEAIRLKNSYLGQIGQFIQPAMEPLGFDWKMSVSLLAGLPAKEVVVSTMGVLYQAEDEDISLTEKLKEEKYISGEKKGQAIISIPVALAFIMFVLIYFPCIGVIATIRNESGKTSWAIFTMIYTTTLAWVLAYFILHISSYFLG